MEMIYLPYKHKLAQLKIILLFYKIILGDKSDNIPSIFNKCGKKTVEKCFDDSNFFKEKLFKENKLLEYERNNQLINFECIPVNLTEAFYTSIASL